MFFGENGDEDFRFFHLLVIVSDLMYFTVHIREAINDTFPSLYIFLNAMHLNLKAKGQFDEQLTFPLHCFAFI